ncbi:MAG: UDP-N-acetylmuramoyl-tripeptide--D-alanyl-D-alanine ligase [Clostridiales bacterium]|jgi:UDP-N-acetylmuramoyl-tripeptide--D-alanyl-D-alanine ligase|nr:UDP-N-acetylmuramoyl-tripeptide--D-alanyl-D-alanine ligase [Clostridiales bacterium]
MLSTIAAVVLLLAFAVDCGVLTLRTVHMLQLNSYRPERYGGWMKAHKDELMKTYGWLLIAVVAVGAYLLAPTDWVVRAVCAALFVIHLILSWPPKAKKPLVFTPRVRRLLVTHGLLLVLVGGGVALTGFNRLGVALLFLWAVLTPFVTLLALLINTPMEKAVTGHYIKDARRRLADMPDLMVIGITGSYGKTSTKNFLNTLLSARYNVLMTPESFNTPLGVVRTVREHLTPSHQVFIAEMGAKNVGDIREICDLVHPRCGMITAIGEQHLETFKSLDNIIRTKFELADAIPAGGTVVLNTDNEHIRARLAAQPPTGRTVTYGLQRADYTADGLTVDSRGSAFTVTGPDGESARFTTRLLGAHNIQNIVGCIAMACALGIELKELVYPVKTLKPVEHRLQLLPNGYIDDAYNSNPAGFRAALDVLAGFEGQRVLVTPGMVELGERQEALNRELGAYAASRCDYAVLVGEKQAPPLKEGLLSAGFAEDRLYVAADLQDGLKFVNTLPADGPRTVLLENDLPDNF